MSWWHQQASRHARSVVDDPEAIWRARGWGYLRWCALPSAGLLACVVYYDLAWPFRLGASLNITLWLLNAWACFDIARRK